MSFDVRRARWLLGVAVVVAATGFWVFVLRGAERPADPYLAPAESSTTAASVTPPGDPDRVALDGFDEVAVAVRPAGSGDWLAWCLLAAREAAQRQRGLMGVTDLQGYSGMAFIYDDDVSNAFYMLNTPMPLSIAWISGDGAVVSTADMEPCPDQEGCPTYPPAGPYRTAIEVPQGGLADLGIEPGAKVIVGGACAA